MLSLARVRAQLVRAPVVDSDRVVVSVESVDECTDRRFVQVAQVTSGLTGLLTQHHGLGADETEGVNDDL